MENHWNHRVLEHNEDDETWYEIHEVHYDENDSPVGWTEKGVSCFGDDCQGLTFALQGFIRAMYAPILRIEGEKLIETDVLLWPEAY